MTTESTVEDRNEKLRALWLLVRRAGGELHIPAEEVAAAPATLGVTYVRQLDGRISLWADEEGTKSAGAVESIEVTPAMENAGIRAMRHCDRRFETEEECVREIYIAMVKTAGARVDG